MSTFQPWRTYKPEALNVPFGWVQWKGTEVCMDLHCKCGALCHVDASFAYFVRCGNCGQEYEMAGYVEARPLSPEEQAARHGVESVCAEADDDMPVTVDRIGR